MIVRIYLDQSNIEHPHQQLLSQMQSTKLDGLIKEYKQDSLFDDLIAFVSKINRITRQLFDGFNTKIYIP